MTLFEPTDEMRRRNRWCTWLLASVLMVAACDRGHDSDEALNAALQAVKYQDLDGLAAVHVEATDRSVYCAEEPMQRLWDKAGTVAESGRCKTLEGVSADEVDSAPDELRFLLQVVRFRCEKPNATCADYGARALRDGAEKSPLWGPKIDGWTVRKRLGDDVQSVAYVDIVVDGETVHRAVKMRRIGESWRVESGLLEAP